MSDNWTPAALDYTGFISYLQAQGANVLRLHVWEQGVAGPQGGLPDPLPYPRTGPGLDPFGRARFDLNQFNQQFFDRLLARVAQAASAGIYAVVVLFNGDSLIRRAAAADPWPSHPFKATNNINGVNGDPSARGDGQDMQRLLIPAITSLQQAYITKVLATLGGQSNVLYEIVNNPADDTATVAWVNAMVAFTRSTDLNSANKHPIGVSSNYATINAAQINNWLAGSGADWITPYGVAAYQDNPPLSTGTQVVVLDSAKTFSPAPAGDAVWVWEQFCSGNNILYLDDLTATGVVGTNGTSLGATLIEETSARAGITGVRFVASMTDISILTPTPTAASTNYATTAPGDVYVVLAKATPFTVNLSAAASSMLTVTWISVATGKAASGGTVTGGSRTELFNAPLVPAVLMLTKVAASLSIATIAPTRVGVPVPLSGGYSGAAPAALDYSSDGSTYFPITSLSVSAGAWSGTGPTLTAPNPSQTVTVRNHALPAVKTTSQPFIVAPAPVETLTINTPLAQLTGSVVALSGSYANASPTALDYSIDNRATWAPLRGALFASGVWQGQGPTFTQAVAAQVIWIRDHSATSITASTGPFAVTVQTTALPPLINDQTPRVAPAITKPGYLQPIIDPLYGTTITRIAGDPGTAITNIPGGVWGSCPRHHYSLDQAWNADQSLIYFDTNVDPDAIVAGGSPSGHIFLDGSTYVPKFSSLPPNSGNADIRWHISDPTLMYYVAGALFATWAPATGTMTTIATFTGYSSLLFGHYKGFYSNNGDVFVFQGLSPSNVACVFAYKVSTGTKYPDILLAPGLSQISSLGTYIALTDANDGLAIYNSVTGALLQTWPPPVVGSGLPSHADMAIDQAGDEVLVGVGKGPTYNGRIVKRRLSDGAITALTPVSPANYGQHVSCRNIVGQGWAFASYPDNNASNYPLYNLEVIAVKLDGTEVRRCCSDHALNTQADYYSQPQCSPSQTGDRVIFASNWGDPFGNGRPVQDYVCDLRATAGISASSGVAETLSIRTPSAATAGAPVALDGGYVNGPPVTFDYSTDAGVTWTALTGVVVGSGAWSGFGPTYPVATVNRQIIVRDHVRPNVQAQTGTFSVSGETLTVATPVNVIVGSPLSLSGTYAGGTPTAFDYSLDSGGTWIALTGVVIANGNWSGFGPTFSATVAALTLLVRDHAQPVVQAITGTFSVGAPPAEALTLITPSSATVGVPLVLSGTYINGTPAAFDYSVNAGASWAPMTAAVIGGGAWHATGPTYTATAASVVVFVRDHTLTSVTASTGNFPVQAAIVETLTVNTPSGVVAGTPLFLSGTVTNGTPAALDYSINNGGTWLPIGSFVVASGLTATVSAVGAMTAVQSGANWTYAITLRNTGLTPIGTFWFAWIPGFDYLTVTPTFTSPPGWTGSVLAGTPGVSIQWLAGVNTLASGGVLAGFGFTTTSSPSVLFAAANPPITTSFVYSGAPFSDAGYQFVVAQGALPPQVQSWSGTGPTFPGAVVSQTLLARDNAATTVTASTGTFAVGAAAAESISVNTPTGVIVGGPVALSGSYANAALAAVDYSVDSGATWIPVTGLVVSANGWSGTGPTYTAQ